jgi:hypothetical protein
MAWVGAGEGGGMEGGDETSAGGGDGERVGVRLVA